MASGALSLALLLSACGAFTLGSPFRAFDPADKPVVGHDAVLDYELLKPWDYDKGFNANARYPLVVSLHGSGGSHYEPCIVGDEREMMDHPCFFLAPTCSDWGSSAAWVRDLIETLKRQYRIDPDRLYLMGFSMGGSGSYSFAKAYYDEHGGIFAGIVRLAGQSQTELPAALAEKTSVWYHIGLEDSASRVEVAEQAYQFIKGFSGARESSARDELSGYPRLTKTLTKRGVEIMKKSEYAGMGHDGGTAFSDPAVLDWLFAQDLANR
jgi:predicted peptidase